MNRVHRFVRDEGIDLDELQTPPPQDERRGFAAFRECCSIPVLRQIAVAGVRDSVGEGTGLDGDGGTQTREERPHATAFPQDGQNLALYCSFAPHDWQDASCWEAEDSQNLKQPQRKDKIESCLRQRHTCQFHTRESVASEAGSRQG